MKLLIAGMSVATIAIAVATQALAVTLYAGNDKSAQFENGSFNLPDLSNPKDVYTILIETADGKTMRIPLPPGATGLRMNASALPPSEWKWRYILQLTQLRTIDVLQPANGRVTYEQLARYDDGVLFVWKHDPSADRYRLTVVMDKQPDHTQPAEWGKETSEELSLEEHYKAHCNCLHYVWSTKPGDRLKFKATALNKDGTSISESEFRTVAIDSPWSGQFARDGFKFQRSDTLSKEIAGKPALFGYSASQNQGTARSGAYQAEFALVWEGGERTVLNQVLYPRASVEARLTSSGTAKTNDVFRARVGADKLLSDVPLNLTGNLKYDTEAKTGTKKGSVELMATPTFAPLARYYPRPTIETTDPSGNYTTRPWIQVMPTVQVGLEAGHTFDVGSSEEKGRSFVRGRVDVGLDAQLNFLASLLRLPTVSLYARSTYWHLIHQDTDNFVYSRTGASFKFTPETSLELTYTVGHDSPTFTFSRSVGVSLGVQF
jgi:hypothetical protein